MRGIIPGDTVYERIAQPDLDSSLRAAATQQSLNEYLARAAAAVRPEFGGQLTYCALPTEQVDWTEFDVAAVDLYRDKLSRPRFGRAVQVFRNKAGRTAARHRRVRVLHLPGGGGPGRLGLGHHRS